MLSVSLNGEIQMRKYLTKCGLYCGACSSMLLHDKALGDESLAMLELEYQDEPCAGCASGVNPDCEFIHCNREHGSECCAFCAEFPCAMITKFAHDEWAHHIDVIDNLHRIKEIGMDAWLEEQKQQWSCPQCGTRTHWYQKVCHQCGATWKCRYE